MLTLLLFISTLTTTGAQPALVDWKQPPALCPEDIIPIIRKGAAVSREDLKDPTFPRTGQEYEDKLLILKANQDLPDKVETIYRTANQYQIPPAILLGSLAQESSLADDGLDLDGGNYACGIAQLNLPEWCTWGESLNSQEADQVDLPKKDIKKFQEVYDEDFCTSDSVEPKLADPFYRRVTQKFPNVSPHRIPMKEYLKLRFQDVRADLASDSRIAKLQYRLARSYFAHCADHRVAIPALAYLLSQLYEKYVPSELKVIEHYGSGEHFSKRCKEPITSRAYPFNTGWLLADVMFNCGERVVGDIASVKTVPWSEFNPEVLIENLSHFKVNEHISSVVDRAGERPLLHRAP